MAKTITILGTGYVGITTAALFAVSGNTVYLVDKNEARLKSVRQGKPFFYEEGVEPVLSKAVREAKVIPTDSYEESVSKSDIVFSAVGTPDNPDGSSNLSFVFAAAEEAAGYLKDDAIFVQKSTVPVGTGKQIQKIFTEASCTAAYVSNPEFLRESTALLDSLWFDRVVVGGTDQEAMQRVLALHKEVEEKRDDIAQLAGITPPENIPESLYVTTQLESAELIKVTSNAFLTVKISFANSIAKLADKVGADINEVMSAVGADPRIGTAFLNAGRGYGGGCLPKDVSGLIARALDFGVDLELLQATQAVNESMPVYFIEKLQESFGGSLQNRTIAVLGLSFKAGTSDTRRSPGIAIANTLLRNGATVFAHDPQAAHEAKEDLHDDVTVATNLQTALKSAEAVIIATDWPEYVTTKPEEYAEMLGGTYFVDAMNRFSPEAVKKAGLTYIGVGRR